MSSKFFVKQKVAMVLVGFSIVAIAAILYTLYRSSELDKEHINLVENSEKIEIKIFEVRIEFASDQNRKNPISQIKIDSLFNSAFQNIDNIKAIASKEFGVKSKENKNFTKELSLLKGSVSGLKPVVDKGGDIKIKQNHLESQMKLFTNAFTNYEKALHLYINQTNQKFKQNIFVLLAFLLILLGVSLFVVMKLMNSLTQAHLQLLRNTMSVEQRERKRIARELHDGLGAILSSISLYGKMLGKDLSGNQTSNNKAIQINQLSKQALDTVSEVINNLNPSVLNQYNLQESLQRLADKIHNLDHLDVDLDLKEFKAEPEQNTKIVIYRICSELINNTLKHANASRITIKLSGKKHLVLQYSDNGIGFNFDAIKTKENGGMGLLNIIERVESINGICHIKTAEDKGFKIRIEFALSELKLN
ncbi:sensor histidine kinase [Marinifilum sp.]|uniref:sensor histidine kinase n=1 Tax=Marinifilum sp. TaxID=2033137 RepID=UPI003BAD5A2A